MAELRVGLEALHSLSPADRAQALLSAQENQWFERKSFRVSPEKLAAAIIGFANAEGGVIAVGLSEGEVETLPPEKTLNQLRRTPHDWCSPIPRTRFDAIEVETPTGTSELLLVEVEPGEALHETRSGEVFLRVGDSTMRLNATQRDELAYDRGGSHYEARPMPGASMQDLDAQAVDQLREVLGVTQGTDRLLATRSLLTARKQVTIAAYLLLGREPQTQMPHAHVRVLRYLSSHAGTGARQSLAADGDQRIEGRIPEIISAAAGLIREWMPHRRALGPSGRFESVPIVPHDAWIEGLVNAVVHRSYSMVGDHIRVAIFPDRIEIESPGRFPGIVDPDRPLDIARYARNPRIARVCNDLGITQEKGEGILRIFEEMRINGLGDPVYKQTSGSVRLTLLSTPRIAPHIEATLPAGSYRILELLRGLGQPLGTGEISAGIGLQRPATLRALRALEALGEVEWHGNSAKDPRATWTLPSGRTEVL